MEVIQWSLKTLWSSLLVQSCKTERDKWAVTVFVEGKLRGWRKTLSSKNKSILSLSLSLGYKPAHFILFTSLFPPVAEDCFSWDLNAESHRVEVNYSCGLASLCTYTGVETQSWKRLFEFYARGDSVDWAGCVVQNDSLWFKKKRKTKCKMLWIVDAEEEMWRSLRDHSVKFTINKSL